MFWAETFFFPFRLNFDSLIILQPTKEKKMDERGILKERRMRNYFFLPEGRGVLLILNSASESRWKKYLFRKRGEERKKREI